MRIIGIDPSIRSTGYAVVESAKGKVSALIYGCIPNPASRSQEKSLLGIHRKLGELIGEFKVEAVAMEKIIYVQSTRTAIIMGSVRGAVMVAVADAGLSVVEYPAKLIKKAATGYGAAQKNQVGFMMRVVYGLRETPQSDAADALAIALAHARALENPVLKADPARK